MFQPAVSIYPLSSGAIAARHSCQADTMVTSAARTNMSINKGATGSPSLSGGDKMAKTGGQGTACKSPPESVSRTSGGQVPGRKSMHVAGCTRRFAISQELAGVTNRGQSPASVGMPRRCPTVRPIHSVCRFLLMATDKCHGLSCRSPEGWRYRLAHWCGWRRDTGIRALSADRACRHRHAPNDMRPRHKPVPPGHRATRPEHPWTPFMEGQLGGCIRA